MLRSAHKKCPMIQVKVEQKIEENLCLICHTNPSEFGISTSCCHFFCVECIKGTLKLIRHSEKDFSGYCPICENSVPTGHQGTPSSGRITGEALTFLQRWATEMYFFSYIIAVSHTHTRFLLFSSLLFSLFPSSLLFSLLSLSLFSFVPLSFLSICLAAMTWLRKNFNSVLWENKIKTTNYFSNVRQNVATTWST